MIHPQSYTTIGYLVTVTYLIRAYIIRSVTSWRMCAQMDHKLCLLWIDECLAPHVKNAPEGIIPLLLLDQYKCHLMSTIVHKIEALGVAKNHPYMYVPKHDAWGTNMGAHKM